MFEVASSRMRNTGRQYVCSRCVDQWPQLQMDLIYSTLFQSDSASANACPTHPP